MAAGGYALGREWLARQWHARGQGFKSPQLHQAFRIAHLRSERLWPWVVVLRWYYRQVTVSRPASSRAVVPRAAQADRNRRRIQSASEPVARRVWQNSSFRGGGSSRGGPR